MKSFFPGRPHYDFRRRRFAESSFNSDGGERRQSFHHHRAVSKDVFRWEMDLRFFAPDLHLYCFPLVEETGFNVTFSGTERLRDRMKGLAGLLDGHRVAVIATVVEAAQKLSVRPVSLRI